MKASVEISMYPLREDYLEPILEFIHALRGYENIEVVTNALSTQLYGDFELIFRILQAEIEKSYLKHGQSPFVIKVLKGDLNEDFKPL